MTERAAYQRSALGRIASFRHALAATRFALSLTL